MHYGSCSRSVPSQLLPGYLHLAQFMIYAVLRADSGIAVQQQENVP